MPNEEIEKPVENAEEPSRRGLFSRRIVFAVLGVSAITFLVFSLIGVGLFRIGVFDSYVRGKFTDRMSEMGIKFEAESFHVTASPLGLHLRNATFSDKITGEKLFFIADADLGMTILDVFSMQLSRDISIDKTDVNGAEVWVKFDENGRSNFSNLKLAESKDGGGVNFRYQSTDLSLQNSEVRFGDLSRKISGDARNMLFSLSPENYQVPDEQKRYKFDLTASDASFVYDGKPVEKIGIRANGVADRNGADISSIELKTPIGDSTMSGTLQDWSAPKYSFDVSSSVDLTQASSILPMGTELLGVGNFTGKISGEGENYKIEGNADAPSLRAGGVYLKALNVEATVSGTNSNYEANGKAVAQMLTYDVFRVDFLKLNGNVRGTGADFRWLGELEAVAARSPSLTLGGLFLSDAAAEYKDREFLMSSGNGRAKRFAIGDTEFARLTTRNLRVAVGDNLTSVSAPTAHADSFTTKDYSLHGISGRNVSVRHVHGRTDVGIDHIDSQTAGISNAKVKNLSADEFRFRTVPESTEITAKNVRADEVENGGTRVEGLDAPAVTLESTSAGIVVYSDNLRVARVDTGAAILGSLNIAGVRLSIRQGTVEARSDDIDAGDIAFAKTRNLPDGGTLKQVKFAAPVYMLEPSGRYRATADMSLGGGIVGSISLGSANAKIDANNDRVALNDLTADVMDGKVIGNAAISLNDRSLSKLNGSFSNLDIAKLIALLGGRVMPIKGGTTGSVDLTFTGTNFRTATGSLNADITANAGNEQSDMIPVAGNIKLAATNGLFTVDHAKLDSAKSELNASGRFDLKDQNSDLTLALRSTDAAEIDRLIRVLGVSNELEHQLDTMQIQFAGNLGFDGKVTGNLSDPIINGKGTLDSISMRGRQLGSVVTDIASSPTGFELSNGKLSEPAGGSAQFNVSVPYTGSNNIWVKATLKDVNAGNLLAALQIDLPERIRDLDGRTSGTVDLSGLPNESQGAIDLTSAKGMVAGQPFDNLIAKAVLHGTNIDLQRGEIRVGKGLLTAKGSYDRASSAFDLDLDSKTIPLPLALTFLPKNDAIPEITGDVDFVAKTAGRYDQTNTYFVNFTGTASNVIVGENAFGEVAFKGQTVNQMLTTDLTASLDGRPQVVNASLNFADENLPLTVATDFDQSPVAPFLVFVPQLKGFPITGTGTGRVEFGGNIARLDDKGNRIYSRENLSGTARFSQLSLQIQDTPLAAAEPILIRFNTREVAFDQARFAGGGSNMTISGTKALTADTVNSLSINGRVNLTLLNLATKDTFFAGFADTSVRLSGTNAESRLSGNAAIENGSVSSFIGSDRLTFERVKTRIIFTSNQAEVEEATGYLGGGKFTATGGGLIDNLAVQAFRFTISGNNVTVPLPKDFITTGDARLEISGLRRTKAENLQMTIAGRVFARRSIYSKDIDLANIVGARRDATLSTGASSFTAPRFDLIVEGRDALVVKNNIADLTASVSLELTGDADNPRLAGRITANSGTILFRKDRYEVQRGVLEFPPNTTIEPVVNLQAESEIAGYRVYVNLVGPLRDSELLSATVRSSPALPQADVVSLITTGSLSNTTGGIPTLAQTGINTAAEILTDTIINNPARKATDKLFGLNVFEIDPIISGRQLNPSARLTVGRQINNNLRVTYSTNLSQDQNQVLALEYRVSNKLSLVAQYEQRSLSNVTRNRDNFSFEIRFRKRF